MSEGNPKEDRRFESTHWSVVLQAAHDSSRTANVALATLCQTYWYPLYAYVRRRVDNADEAQDLTQEFFTRLLEKEILLRATPERGRFRSYLLTAMKHFLVNEWKRAKSQKRGGGKTALSLDFQAGESRFTCEPSHTITAERLYDRQWASSLIQHVLALLRDEYFRNGTESHYEHLSQFISGRSAAGSYVIVARRLEMTEGTVRVAVHRMRGRFRELLRAEIAQTVSDPGEVDDEIRSLFAAVGS